MLHLEDSRILNDYAGMESAQIELKSHNHDLMTKCRIRDENKDYLIKLLRNLNLYIDCGSKLRVGKASSDVLTACRKAVKSKKPDIIANAILHGIQ